MNRTLAILGAVIVVIGIVASSAFFTVQMTEQVIVVQFGDPKRVINEPGLHMKLPFIQEVRSYERRILSVDPPTEQVILEDQRRLDVDSFVRYRIIDPLRFFQTVTNEEGARARISTVTNAALRRVLGNQTQQEILSEERAVIMNAIRQEVEAQARSFGIGIVDVRIGRADVPVDTREAVFRRMRSERQQEAADFRAQGEASARRIRSYADCVETVILAHARRQSQSLRGIGDGEAITIQADAFSRAPEFFAFYRSLEAYRTALGSDDTTLVLSPDSEFFRYFNGLDTASLHAPVIPAPSRGRPGTDDEAGPRAAPVDETPLAPLEDVIGPVSGQDEESGSGVGALERIDPARFCGNLPADLTRTGVAPDTAFAPAYVAPLPGAAPDDSVLPETVPDGGAVLPAPEDAAPVVE